MKAEIEVLKEHCSGLEVDKRTAEIKNVASRTDAVAWVPRL